MPSDAPVGEVFDVFGKMGHAVMEIIRLLFQAKQSREQKKTRETLEKMYNNGVKDMVSDAYGTGEVNYQLLRDREGLQNLSFKMIPQDSYDDFEKIAKEIGFPYSFVNTMPDPNDAGKLLAVVAYSKNHEDAMALADQVLDARAATPAEIQQANINPVMRDSYEDLHAQGGGKADLFLVPLGSQQNYEAAKQLATNAGIRVMDPSKHFSEDFLNAMPQYRTSLCATRADLPAFTQLMQKNGISISPDAPTVMVNAGAYNRTLNMMTQQLAAQKQQAAQTRSMPVQTISNQDHLQVLNLNDQERDQLRQALAGRNIGSVMMTGPSGLTDVLINAADKAEAEKALGSIISDSRKFVQPTQEEFEGVWCADGREQAIQTMDIRARAKSQTQARTQGGPVQEYMYQGSDALKEFDAGEASRQSSGSPQLGTADWSAMTKGDADVELVAFTGPQEYATFTQTVGTDVPFAAAAGSSGSIAVAFSPQDHERVMNAADKAAPGSQSVLLVPPDKDHVIDPKAPTNAERFGGNMPFRQMTARYQNLKAVEVTPEEAKAVSAALKQNMPGTHFAVANNRRDKNVRILFQAENESRIMPEIARLAPNVGKAEALAPAGRVNSGRSLIERVKNALQPAQSVQQSTSQTKSQTQNTLTTTTHTHGMSR